MTVPDALLREIAEAPAPKRYRCIYLVLDGERSHLCGREPGPGRLLLCEEHARMYEGDDAGKDDHG